MASAPFFNFEPFDEKKTSWSRWAERFKTALELYDCEAEKHAKLLLHFMGSATYNLLCDKVMPLKPEEMTYQRITAALHEHFDPTPNEILENFRFNMRKQKAGETCSEFAVSLRRLAVNCNFSLHLEKALRNQFVFGLLDKNIQSNLLKKKSLSLTEVISVATAYELAEKGGEELQGGNDRESVNKVGYKKNKEHKEKKEKLPVNNKKCFRCGNSSHLADKCKYKEFTCHFCNKKGHLKKMCLKQKTQKKSVNQIDEEDSVKLVEELFKVEMYGEVHNISRKIECELSVNNAQILFEVDTGSPVSIVNLEDAKKHFAKSTLKKTKIQLVSYCGTPLECLGYIWVQVADKTSDKTLKLYIVRSNRKPLLGREWLREIKIDWNETLNRESHNTSCVNQIERSQNNYKIENLVKRYPNLFSKTTGKIRDLQARLYVKPNTIPKFVKHRRVPFPLLEAVERQLDEQVAEGLLKKVETSEWATPIVVVRKKGGNIRICGDYKVTLNPVLLVDEHPLPTVEELFSKMAGGKKFSKIDLSTAYLQLEIHPEDRHLLTLSTHKGLYEPTRMMYGIASAPAKWQRLMEQRLSDIPGVSVFLDDIKITAPDDCTHIRRVEEVLSRLERCNMRVNLEKSEFFKDSIEYCGYVISKEGIQRMKSKIQAIQDMKIPTNREEVRAFMGLVNYYGRFVKNLSDIVYPINQLLRNNVQFVFDSKCLKAFNAVKRHMQSDVILTHYDPKLPVTLAVDASPIGVGAVLSHTYDDGSERPIQFASQTLSKVQQRYSQLDKEAYAIIFGIRKFYQYLYGRKFVLITDNRAISQIFSPSKGIPIHSATRMQHYALFLEQYNYVIKCKRSKENANADALSRLPTIEEHKFTEEVYMVEEEFLHTLPVTVSDLQRETKADKSVKSLLEGLKYGRTCEPKDRFGIDQHEFSLHDGCILRGMRVYIPGNLRPRVLEEMHTAHFGIVRMKSLARAYVWWNNLDKDIEELVQKCVSCQVTRPNPKKVPSAYNWKTPTKVFERVHVDYAGPIMGKYLFVLIDAYSKWPEVHVTPNMNTTTTIEKCREIFSQFGIPNILVSDHGRQFDSNEFQEFLKANGVIHKQGAPYHPATNGQAERYIQTIKSKLIATKCTADSIKTELSKILLAYRRTIHPVTSKSPSMLMLGRQIQSRLDLLLPHNNQTNYHQEVRSTHKKMSNGDRVAVRDYLSKNKWQFGVIESCKGELHYNVRLDDGRVWTRHTDQMRRSGVEVGRELTNTPDEKHLTNQATTTEESKNEEQSAITTQSLNSPNISYSTATTEPKELPTSSGNKDVAEVEQTPATDRAPQPQLRRSQRQRKAPQRL